MDKMVTLPRFFSMTIGVLLSLAASGQDVARASSVVVSVDMSGAPVGLAYTPSVSGDGRFVSFMSPDDSIVPDDTNRFVDVGGITLRGYDVFVRDRARCKTERVSVSSDGAQVLGDSHSPTISDDGRYVAFISNAGELWPEPTFRPREHVYVHDRLTGETRLVSSSSAGAPGNAGSGTPDGRTAMSGDGRYVAFASNASNLVPGDTNGEEGRDVFVRDLVEETILRASVDSTGNEQAGYSTAAVISADGLFVAFTSTARLVPEDVDAAADLYLRNLSDGLTRRINVSEGGEVIEQVRSASISGEGCRVAFSVATGETWLFDCSEGFAREIPAGASPVSVVARDGNFVAVVGQLDAGPRGVYRHDLVGGFTFIADVAAQVTSLATSADGKFFATDLPVTIHAQSANVPSVCEEPSQCAGETLSPATAATCALLGLSETAPCSLAEMEQVPDDLMGTAYGTLWVLGAAEEGERGKVRRDALRSLRRVRTEIRRLTGKTIARPCSRNLRRTLREASYQVRLAR